MERDKNPENGDFHHFHDGLASAMPSM